MSDVFKNNIVGFLMTWIMRDRKFKLARATLLFGRNLTMMSLHMTRAVNVALNSNDFTQHTISFVNGLEKS